MSDIIEFPGPPDRPITEDETDKLHAEAFRDLEGRIADCVVMAGIAARIVSELKITEGGTNEVHFTVFHTFQMLKKLQADYDAVYNTDKPMPL
jgi:hypothetical protein